MTSYLMFRDVLDSFDVPHFPECNKPAQQLVFDAAVNAKILSQDDLLELAEVYSLDKKI